jgi:hypothetical protein
MAGEDIIKGQIRHPTRTPEVIIKCVGPYDSEAFAPNGKIQEISMFISTREFPKYHYVIVEDVVESYLSPGVRFCVVRLITHSNTPEFDNVKITDDLFDKSTTTINLSSSNLTRDIFLIPVEEIQPGKVYGHFDLKEVKEITEY